MHSARDRPGISSAKASPGRSLLVWSGGIALLLLGAALYSRAPRLVWNASASVPIGLYRIDPGLMPRRGELALVRLPYAVRALAARRGYLPSAVPALKPVAALSGDTVCAAGDRVTVAGARAVLRRPTDALRRPLPRWEGCLHLRAGEVFLMAERSDSSFDGRYFGRVPSSAIIGRARRLWPA